MSFQYQMGRLLLGTTQHNESLTFYWKPMDRAAHHEQGCKFYWNSYCSKVGNGCMYAHMYQDPARQQPYKPYFFAQGQQQTPVFVPDSSRLTGAQT